MIKQEVLGIASEFWNKVIEDAKANTNTNKGTNYKTTKKQNAHQERRNTK